MSSNECFVLMNDESVPVIIETRRGARNVTLRPKLVPEFEIHISKPWTTSNAFVMKFLESKRKWIEKIFANAPRKEHIKSGDVIEFLGRTVQLIHNPQMRGNKYMDSDKTTLCIGGTPDMFERRVRDCIRDEFLCAVKEIIRTTPRELWPTRISLRDTTSRCGSCSSNGSMSLSWRLAFAPYDVMRYVVMHELAHRKHMDHSAAFWATVSQLYGFGVERAKRWLGQNGANLHKYF